MKKLLFTGLMIFNLFSIAAENEVKKSEKESIYLINYLENRELPEVPVVDCKKIKALSEDEFNKLLNRLFTRAMIIIHVIDCSDQYRRMQQRFKKEHMLAERINNCRSIVPFVLKEAHTYYIPEFENLSKSKDLLQLSQGEFEGWKKEASILQKKVKWDTFFFEGFFGNAFQAMRTVYDLIVVGGQKEWHYEPKPALVKFMLSQRFIKEVETLRK